MKQSTIRLAAVVALLACTSLTRLSADPLNPVVLGADELLGTVFPGTPANEENATRQVKYLVDAYNVLGLATVDGTVLPAYVADPGPEVYTLYNPAGAPASLAAPVISGESVDGPSPLVDLGGFTYQYVLFFQANSAWVYYIGNIAGTEHIKWGGDPVPTPDPSVAGNVISHYVLFNKKSGGVIDPHSNVPDGGTTVLLVGLGLLLTAFSARQKKTA